MTYCMQVCVMVGSSVFQLFATRRENLYKIPLYLHAVAFLSMAVSPYHC